MRGWIAVNLFFIGLVGAAAGILFAGVAAIRSFAPEYEHQLVGWLALLAVIIPGIAARAFIQRFERKR